MPPSVELNLHANTIGEWKLTFDPPHTQDDESALGLLVVENWNAAASMNHIGRPVTVAVVGCGERGKVNSLISASSA